MNCRQPFLVVTFLKLIVNFKILRVEDFEVLPEYEWLVKNAPSYGFELSYSRGKKGITFEPWHWRYVGKTS